MADDQKLNGAAALRAQSKVPLAGATSQSDAAPAASAEETPASGAAALRAQSKVPLSGNATSQSDTAPAPEESTWDQVKDYGKQFYQGGLEGIAGAAGLPALAAHGVNKLLAPLGFHPPIEDPANAPLKESWMPSGFLKSEEGIGYDPTQQPKGFGQEMVRGLGRATGTLPLAGFAGMGPAAAAAYTYGPSIAGDLFHHFAPDWNPLWASLPAALTMTGAERLITEGIARNAATTAAEKAAQEQAAATAARQAHEAGSADASLLQKTQARGVKDVAGAFKEGSEADIAKWHDSEHTAADAQLQAEHAAADTHLQTEHTGADADREAVASSLGQADTVQRGGEALQDAARSWKKTDFPTELKDAENQMYKGAVNIPEDALGNLNQFESSLKNSFYKAGELEPIAQRLRSRMPEGLENAINQIKKERGIAPDQPLEATLDDMRKLRSVLGDAMTSPKLTEGVDAGKMNELYRALSGDMEGAISKASGPEGLAQFKKFNEEARRLYGIASGPVSDVISTTDKAGETIAPGDAVSATLKGSDKDGTRLAQLSSEPTLKKGLNEVAASQLRTGKGPGVTQGDPDKFFTTLAPESKTALFGDETAGKLQDAIDRRTAAETNTASMKTTAETNAATTKTAADTKRDELLNEVKKGKKDIIDTGAANRDVQTAARSKTGTELRQAQENAVANTQAAVAKAKDLQKRGASVGGIELPFWIRNMPSLASGYLGGQHLLNEFGTTLPDWGNQLTAGIGAGVGYLASKGARELVGNPLAARNLLVGGAASGAIPKPAH